MILKQAARAILDAGLGAVEPEACVTRHLHISGSLLHAGNVALDLDQIRYIYVAGACKASAAMARQVEDLLVTGPTRTNVMDMQILLVSGYEEVSVLVLPC